MDQYLKEHMLTPEVIKKYDLKVGSDRIEIPIKDPQGNYLFSKYRVFNKPNTKYLYDKGSQMALFNAECINKETIRIYLVEGEFDAIAFQQFFDKEKLPYVSVSSTGGAGSWKLEWNELLNGIDTNIILDNDTAGRKGSIRLWELIPNSLISRLDYGVKDVCEMIFYLKNKGFVFYDLFRIQYNELTTLKKINETLSFLDENDLHYGSNKEFNDLMRIKLAEMYQRKRMENRRKVKNTENESDFTKNDIYRLKEIPISNFIVFKNGVAPCIFHNDKNPSMHYNDLGSKLKNTVKCYSCGKFADVIDVIIQLEDVDFKGALEYLRKYNGTDR